MNTGNGKPVEYEIPLNILHKFGEDNVSKIVTENEEEVS